jgi:predicted alpha/beta superfamily hydrolase
MRKLLLVYVVLLLLPPCYAQVLPKPIAGKIERIDSLSSKFVTARNIDIWLPDGYSKEKKYPVLYMHDGQMLFDSSITWNKQSWDVDDVTGSLIQQNKIVEVIVVGIWNGGITRHPDYFPQKAYESLTATEKDTIVAQLQRAGRTKEVFKPQSDNYLKFIIQELKPIIDSEYSTYTDQSHTFIAGSSMGGLISMYAICEYPQVFGGAACLSTHWPGVWTVENNPIPNAFVNYLSNNLPSPKNHRIYFDYGNQTLDALYPSLQKKVDVVMKEKGFGKKNWITKFYPGENHSEQAWKKRLHIPLLFLLKK